MATGRVCNAQLVLKASNSQLRYPWKALADLAFPFQVSNRPVLLRTSNVHGVIGLPSFECRLDVTVLTLFTPSFVRFFDTRWSWTLSTGLTLGFEFESDRRNNCIIRYIFRIYIVPSR